MKRGDGVPRRFLDSLGGQGHDAVGFQFVQQGQTGVHLVLPIGRGPAEMFTHGAGQFLPTQVGECLHRGLDLRQLFPGEPPPAERGLG